MTLNLDDAIEMIRQAGLILQDTDVDTASAWARDEAEGLTSTYMVTVFRSGRVEGERRRNLVGPKRAAKTEGVLIEVQGSSVDHTEFTAEVQDVQQVLVVLKAIRGMRADGTIRNPAPLRYGNGQPTGVPVAVG